MTAPALSEFEAAFADFMRMEVGEGGAAQATIRSYWCLIRAWLGWCNLMRVDPAAAARCDVKRYRRMLKESDYKPSSIRDMLSVVRRFYQAASNAGLREDNPADGVRSPRIRNAVDDFKYLSDDELARLFSVIPDPEQAAGEEKVRRLRNLLMVHLMALH